VVLGGAAASDCSDSRSQAQQCDLHGNLRSTPSTTTRGLKVATAEEHGDREGALIDDYVLSRAHMTDIVEIQLGRARPLKRVIQRSLQNPLATQILEGRIKDGETVKVGVEGGELSVGGQRVLSEAADD
jgi:ATP-dependent Clp protease ATP-binding subunit ClpB